MVLRKFFSITPLVLLIMSSCAMAQDAERWFQIELSIFSNESVIERDEELWQTERYELAYPPRIERLKSLMDLLMIDALKPSADEEFPDPLELPLSESVEDTDAFSNSLGPDIVPPPPPAIYPQQRASSSSFTYYDYDRESLTRLPSTESDFIQTNRAIERSGDHRLLFHGLWRQPVVGEDQAASLYVNGGETFGDQQELQGTITIRFNDNADRVVIDADLWLSEFTISTDEESTVELPEIPRQFRNPSALRDGNDFEQLEYTPSRIFHMEQSRDMRSTEFHYLDHPAMGIVILVLPYEVPAIPDPMDELLEEEGDILPL
jgi:hypothetical protein